MSTTTARETACAYRFLAKISLSFEFLIGAHESDFCRRHISGVDKSRGTILEIEAGRIDIGASIQVRCGLKLVGT
jgi:hypothetical protein